MNCGQFKDPVSHMCHAGTVVASWSLTQKMTGLNPFNNRYFKSLNTANPTFTSRTNPVVSKDLLFYPLFTKKTKLSFAADRPDLSVKNL